MTYFKTRGLVLILFVCCFREVILVMNYRFTSWALGSIRVQGGVGGEQAKAPREPQPLGSRGNAGQAPCFLLSPSPDSCSLSDSEYVSPTLRLFSVSSFMCFSLSLPLFLTLSFSPVFPPLSIPGFDQNSP